MHRMILLLSMLAASFSARAELHVFACEPEWEALAKAIGGDRVDAYSATTALQDPHYIQARPSLIARVRAADLIVCSGAQLEIGWLPVLLQKGSNPKVQPGTPGFLEASAFVRRLEVPAAVDRALGDIHPEGNPHIQMNPHNISQVAKVLAERMAGLDASGADAYRAGLDDFLKRWDTAMAAWEARAAPLRGRRVIAHHKSWAYLENWLGLQEVGTLEPVAGLPPTASHLAELLARVGQGGADCILRTPFQEDRPSQWLSERSGIPALMLPLTVGGSERATDLFTLFADVLDRLLGKQP